jgi:hypothetical protein
MIMISESILGFIILGIFIILMIVINLTKNK